VVGGAQLEYGKTPFEIRGADAVQDFLGAVAWEEPEPGTTARCMCDGNYHINIYRGTELRISLGYHHGKLLRWRNSSWRTDLEMTKESREAIPAWFAARGFSGFRAVLGEDRRGG
jgi:hypothetical protein